MRYIFNVVFLLLSLSTYQVYAATDCTKADVSEAECRSLLELYNKTNGAAWSNKSGWNTDDIVCTWHGIYCKKETNSPKQTVFNIVLTTNNLSGSLPNLDLPYVQAIDLIGNNLTGEIPNFNKLPNLEYLDLGENQLIGAIPNFSNLPKLTILHIYRNQLTGNIPDFNLPELDTLSLAVNKLTGSIPHFNLPKLTTLELSNNQLSDISNFNNKMVMLSSVNISYNTLRGSVPTFDKLPRWATIDLTNNYLSGPLPHSIYSNIFQIKLLGNCGLVSDNEELTVYLDSQSLGWQTRNPSCPTLTLPRIDNGQAYINNKEPIFSGDTVNLTVTANDGFTFTGWTPAPCANSFTMPKNDVTCTANFVPKKYRITVSSEPKEGGNVTCTSSDNIPHGSKSECTTAANTGYVFTDFKGDCSGTSCVLNNVTSDKNVVANFVLEKYSITPATDGKGKVEPASLQLEYGGNPAQFRLSPDTGYELDDVQGCGGTISPQRDSYTIPPISEKCEIKATFKLKTYKVAISVVPEGSGSIGISSPIEIKHGNVNNPTFSVTPASEYEFGNVTGCVTYQGNNIYAIGNVTDNCDVTIGFIKKGQISIKTTVLKGKGLIDPQVKSLDKGSSATFTLIPKIGYEVDIDTVSGCNRGPIVDNTFTTDKLDKNCEIVASFKAKSYTVSTKVKTDKGGSINPANSHVEYGNSTTFTITPAIGYDIDRVDGCSGSLQDAKFTTGLINADCEVTASFKPTQWTLTGFANGKGSISPVSQNIPNGQQAQFNLMPNTGYEVENVTSNCTGVRSDSIYIINQVTANCSVTVSFKPKSYTIQTKVRPFEAGSIKLTSNSIGHDQKIEFSVIPNDGYYIELVRGCKGEIIIPSNGVYITNPVTEDACVLRADFISQKYQIKLTYQYLNGSSRVASLDAIEHGTSTGFDIPPSEKVDNIIGCGGRLENNHYTTGVITAPCEIVVYYSNSNISQCTTFNLLMRPQVYVACVKVGDAVYEAGMNMISASPKMRFEVDMSTLKNTSLIPNQQCAIFPAPNTANRLKLNCLDLINSRYWVEMSLVDNPDAIQFDLIDFAEN